jgi:FdhE protein
MISLSGLQVQHPEWRPLLAVIAEALREDDDPHWAAFVPAPHHAGAGGRPLLDGAVIEVAPKFIARWTRRILKVAAAAGTDVSALVKATTTGVIDPLLVFEIAVSQDVHRLDELARLVRDERGVIHGLAPLIARPMLQACRQKWADRVPVDWTEGRCPICGGAPTLEELRGLDGGRRLRCGGCGGDWGGAWLRCTFCGETDHEHLGSLMSPDTFERQAVSVCESCGSYIKTITTLTPISPRDLLLLDLETLVLDLAALERGYGRPSTQRPGIAVNVVAEPSWLRELIGRRR